MSIQIEKVVTNNFEMKYFRFGTGERTAVILPGLSVKSVMGSADAVANAYADIKDRYTVYVFDRREELPDGYTVTDMADDTAEAFRALGLSGIYLYGVSMGGMIAQKIALDHPDLVTKLALCSTVAEIPETGARVIGGWLEAAVRGDEETLNRRIVDAVYSHAFVEKYGRFIMAMMSGADDRELRRFIISARGCMGFDVYDRLGELSCPVLIIGGREDKIFDFRHIEELAERSGGELRAFDNCGHAVYDETPECIRELVRFFDRII